MMIMIMIMNEIKIYGDDYGYAGDDSDQSSGGFNDGQC